jgi:nucleoside-diphosphate-sugar epimerase
MKKLLITGGKGFLGSHIARVLNSTDYEIITFSSREFDLTKRFDAQRLLEKYNPDIIVHAAARLGGIGDNQVNPSEYFETNMLIGINLFKSAADLGIRNIINIGTVCSYPKYAQIPFREEELWSGFPEDTNAAYGISKRALIAYAGALNKQYGMKIRTLLLANLYGIGDDFREGTSHVIPALIKKIEFAKRARLNVEIWGDGTPTRDFLNVKDAALAVKMLVDKCDYIDHFDVMNIATGESVTIGQLAALLVELMEYKGGVTFDKSKPNGQPFRVLSVDRASSVLGFRSKISIKQGLEETIDYYITNKKDLDKLKPKYG